MEIDATLVVAMRLARSGKYRTAHSLKRAVRKAVPEASEEHVCLVLTEIGKRS